MKKLAICLILIGFIASITGCSSTPETKAEAQQPMFEDFQKMSAKILESKGLAVVGLGESKSLDLALKKAKMNGRQELAQLLQVKIEAIQKSFMEETGLAEEANILAQFSNTAQAITSEQIQGSAAKELKYEVIDGVVTAYALMELDPSLVMNHLAKEKELYTRFRATQAFDYLDKEIKEYETFKAGQQMPSE